MPLHFTFSSTVRFLCGRFLLCILIFKWGRFVTYARIVTFQAVMLCDLVPFGSGTVNSRYHLKYSSFHFIWTEKNSDFPIMPSYAVWITFRKLRAQFHLKLFESSQVYRECSHSFFIQFRIHNYSLNWSIFCWPSKWKCSPEKSKCDNGHDIFELSPWHPGKILWSQPYNWIQRDTLNINGNYWAHQQWK